MPNLLQQTESDGRHRYSAIDMLQQAKGLPTPEGWAILTKDFVNDLMDELERLYGIEEAVQDYLRGTPAPSSEGLLKALNNG